MLSNFVKGIILLVLGIAVLLPTFWRIISHIILIAIGLYLIYRGLKFMGFAATTFYIEEIFYRIKSFFSI